MIELMKNIFLFLSAAGLLCGAGKAAAQVPASESGNASRASVVVEQRGDTLVYRLSDGTAGLVEDPFGRRYDLHGGLAMPRHVLSVEYGIFPACGTRQIFSGSDVDSEASDGFSRYREGSLRSTGAAGVSYACRVNGWVEVGATLSYVGLSRDAEFYSDDEVCEASMRERYVTVMPFARIYWLTRRNVRLYSTFQVGFQWAHREPYFGDADNKGYLAGHFSLLGVSVGRRLFAYAEGGVGMRGIAVCGVGYRFGGN